MGAALGDVRRRQPRDRPARRAREVARSRRRRATASSGCAWVSCDALRRAGRARRCRSASAGRRARPRATAASASKSGSHRLELVERDASPPLAVDDDHVLERPAGSSRASRTPSRNACSMIDDLRAGVGDDVGDLLGRGGLVDRERRSPPSVTTARSARMELGPVVEHQRDRVAALDAELRAARRRSGRRARAARSRSARPRRRPRRGSPDRRRGARPSRGTPRQVLRGELGAGPPLA